MPVCPLSVLSNWEKQIKDHVILGKLSSYTYHGDSKGVTAATLQSYDVSSRMKECVLRLDHLDDLSIGRV